MGDNIFNPITGELIKNDCCSYCGKPLIANAKFCSYCGTEVNNSDGPSLEETLEWLKGYIEHYGYYYYNHNYEQYNTHNTENPIITFFNGSYSNFTNFEIQKNNKILITMSSDSNYCAYRNKFEYKDKYSHIYKYSFSLLDIVKCFVDEPFNFTERLYDYKKTNLHIASTPENGVVFPIVIRCKSMLPLINLTYEITTHRKSTEEEGNPMPDYYDKKTETQKINEMIININDADIAKRICNALNYAIKIAGGNLREPF
ncbi:MAG: zinc-ribbon domain-containing protein [Bacteroidales bacterium]|jgi:hypothetical protein